jgi:hypothetical protein
MESWAGPEVFWKTLYVVTLTLSASTIIGRYWCNFFPTNLKPVAFYYLAPSFGLATLTVIASSLGRYIALGDSIVVPCTIIATLFWVVYKETDRWAALQQALTMSAFGIVCGVSVLSPLYFFGAFNPHNDSFTYLAHSSWLQEHAFNQTISQETITPQTTQVALYQNQGFRMGGSFLLGLIQATLHLRWAFEVFPGLIITAITCCCAAMGFSVANLIQPIHRFTRFAILALPMFSFGGLVFAANFGFLPQTLGLSLGASVLFLIGPLVISIAKQPQCGTKQIIVAIPIGVLLSAAFLAYSEVAPFIVLAMLVSSTFIGLRYGKFNRAALFLIAVGIVSCILLNIEIMRAFIALRTQSGAVVGSPVDWSLLGFFSHAVGIHGGAWDGFQWTLKKHNTQNYENLGLICFGLVCLLITYLLTAKKQALTKSTILPSVSILILFGLGIVYFRFFKQSPFPVGMGQSWSQFKLADWSHPFAALIVLTAMLSTRRYLKTFFEPFVLLLFCVGLSLAGFVGVERIRPLTSFYGGTTNLHRFYLTFKETVESTCAKGLPIFLGLGEEDHKFRQMATLYLADRELLSDWTDDDYIAPFLPSTRKSQNAREGNCLVELSGPSALLAQSAKVGKYQVGITRGLEPIRVGKCDGGYARESNGTDWWCWVNNKVSFKLQPVVSTQPAFKSKLTFEYLAKGMQTLKIQIKGSDGFVETLSLRANIEGNSRYEHIISVAPSVLQQITIETDGQATLLGNGDSRSAAWMIRNLSIKPHTGGDK